MLVNCVFRKPTSLHPFTKTFWSTSCFLLLTSFLKMLIFQQDLAPAHTAKSSKSWLNDHGVGVLDWPEAIKPAQTKLSLAFSVFTSTLCVSVCDIWCCLSIFIAVLMATKQQQAFRIRMCVRPCLHYLTGGDTHILCVACLGEEHAQSALESAGCEHCDMPGNVVASGYPPPLRRVSEPSAQMLPAASPLQDVVLTAQLHTNPETSLERLVPQLHRRLVDSSSIASVGSSASRCRSCPHEKIGVTAKRQKKCAFSITEDHIPGRDIGTQCRCRCTCHRHV